MLSIYYNRNFILFFLGDREHKVDIADLKECFKSVGTFLDDIIHVKDVEKLEIHIDYLDNTDFGIDLSLFTSCKELVIHSEVKNAGINYNALPQNLEKLIIKYNTFRGDTPTIDMPNLPNNITYLILSGIIVESLDYLPITLLDINFYEVYLNNNDYFDLPPNVKNFLATYTAKNFKVGKEIKNVIHGGNNIKISKQYLQGGLIKNFL